VVASTLIDSPGSQYVALAKIQALTRVHGVAARSGPYPVTFTSLAVNGHPENASVHPVPAGRPCRGGADPADGTGMMARLALI
jgi:hypothetical protein